MTTFMTVRWDRNVWRIRFGGLEITCRELQAARQALDYLEQFDDVALRKLSEDIDRAKELFADAELVSRIGGHGADDLE